MRVIRVTSTVGIFLLFGTIIPVYGQGDKQDKGGQPHGQQGQQQQHAQQPQQQKQQQQQHAQQPQQQQRQQQPQQQQARQQAHPERTRQQAQSWQQQRGWVQKGGWQGRGSWQQNRARHWDSDHRTWAQRGGYGGYYIPQQTFGLYFGIGHFFRLRTRPVMYLGYPRFDYGGFSFLLVDPWPEYWSENWYDSDDVYIDYYGDGYYLYNRRYPRVALAVSIVL